MQLWHSAPRVTRHHLPLAGRGVRVAISWRMTGATYLFRQSASPNWGTFPGIVAFCSEGKDAARLRARVEEGDELPSVLVKERSALNHASTAFYYDTKTNFERSP